MPGLLIPGEVPQNSGRLGIKKTPVPGCLSCTSRAEEMAKTSESVRRMLLVACAGPEHCQNGWTPNCFSNSSHIGNIFIVQFYLPPNTEGQRGQENEAKTCQNIDGPMQSICRISWCVSLLFIMMWSKGWTENTLFRVNFIFQCSTTSGAWISRHAKHQDLFFWSPRVDLVLKVKWHIRLYSCTFWQTCISLPSLLKKACSCSYMRHIYIYTYIS